MKYYAYYRVSTLMQEDDRQREEITKYCQFSNIQIDGEVTEKVSGGESYESRKLLYLLEKMDEGDCLIVADCSRLSRSMSNMSEMINKHLKPNKLRLIIVSMNWDIDCCNMTTITEFLLNVISFGSQMEKEMKNYQCAEGRNIKLKQLKEQGYFISRRSGQKRTHWGNEKGVDLSKARAAAGIAATEKRLKWLESSSAVILVKQLYPIKNPEDIVTILNEYIDAGKDEFKPRRGEKWTLNSYFRILRYVKSLS